MSTSLMIKAASFTFKNKVSKVFSKDSESPSFFSKSTSQLPSASSESPKKSRAQGMRLSPTRVFQPDDQGRPEAPENLCRELGQEVGEGSWMRTSGYYKGFVPSLFYLVSIFSFGFSASLFWYHLLTPEQKGKSFGDVPVAFKRGFTAIGDIGLMVFWFGATTQAVMWCKACFADLDVYIVPPASRSGCGVFLTTTVFGYVSALLFTITTIHTSIHAHTTLLEFCGYTRPDDPTNPRRTRKNRRSLFTIPGRDEDLTHKFSKRGGKKAVVEETKGVRASVTGGGRPPWNGRGPNKSTSLVEIEIN
ncbi:hypothetical protein BC829DRAFT_396807 [Chytridium lagenaria]|nr:hypothetical protein BC829DRAFT_396807 [Chytridium lagenaria]